MAKYKVRVRPTNEKNLWHENFTLLCATNNIAAEQDSSPTLFLSMLSRSEILNFEFHSSLAHGPMRANVLH